jgi:hypothetical protein
MINFGRKEMMKLKNQVFSLIIILVCLVTCKLSSYEEFPYEYNNEFDNFHGVGFPDGASVTIYLDDDYDYTSSYRALTPEFAKESCDYFEVTFFYNKDNDPAHCVVARGEWMLGNMARVNGVQRDVNYGNVEVTYNYKEIKTIITVEVPDPTAEDPNNTKEEQREIITYEIDSVKTPVSGVGSAILFAGKSDKTLLAIGRLTAVNNGNGMTAGTTITANTKSVTFTLAAITASAATPVMDGSNNITGFTPSSFKTSAGLSTGLPTHANATTGNTIVKSEKIFKHSSAVVSDKPFPLFYLGDDSGRNIKATYTFELHSSNDLYNFNAYKNGGIFISTPAFGSVIPGIPPVPLDSVPAEIVKKQPRYTSYNNAGAPIDFYHESILMLDENTVVMIDNNNTPHAPFEPEVQFSFYTDFTLKGSVFALIFSIPVYALREVDDNGIKSRWYIRSNYGASLYDLDDGGTNGKGGAVLLGMGVYHEPDTGTYRMRIVTPPNKWDYYDKSKPDDRIFDINGLIVVLETLSEPPMIVKTIPFAELIFKLGKQDKYGRAPRWTGIRDTTLPGDPPDERYPWTFPEPVTPPYRFPDDFYGCIEIKVEYSHDNGQTYYGTFYLLIGTKGDGSANQNHDFSSITKEQIAHIYDWDYSGNPSYNNDGNPNNDRHVAWDDFPNIASFRTAHEKFRHVMEYNGYQNQTIIIIVHNSFDIVQGNGNAVAGVPRMYFIMAADDGNTPPVVIGRGGTGANLNSVIYQMENPGLNGFYIGTWPFSGSPGSVTIPATKPFTINSAGPYTGQTVANATTLTMFRNNNTSAPGSGMYNFKINGATINTTVTIPPVPPSTEPTYTYPYLY